MQKIFTLLAIVIVLLSSCQKNDEYLNAELINAKHDDDIKANAEIKHCSILQITYSLAGGTTDILQFTYNSFGDPVRITRNLGGHTGYPNFSFKYNQTKKLTDFIGNYDGNTAAEFWHKYFYDRRGRIVRDSTYIFPAISNGLPESAYSRQLTFYTYDNYDRIIKDSTVFSNSDPVIHVYTYDSNGNRVGSSYDNGFNVNRTNKIWMFLNRDYSINNPFKADSYNTTGLPASFDLPTDGTSFSFLGNVYPKAQIVYSCDERESK